MKKYNRLKENLDEICRKKNKGVFKRSDKWYVTTEIEAIALALEVTIRTVWNWYYNSRQPRGWNEIALPIYLKIKLNRFYYTK